MTSNLIHEHHAEAEFMSFDAAHWGMEVNLVKVQIIMTALNLVAIVECETPLLFCLNNRYTDTYKLMNSKLRPALKASRLKNLFSKYTRGQPNRKIICDQFDRGKTGQQLVDAYYSDRQNEATVNAVKKSSMYV